MTKAQEILILAETVKALGSESYSGQWLAEQMPFIRAAIESDMPVETRAITLRQSQAQAQVILAAAQEDAHKMRQEAALVTRKAHEAADALKEHARQQAKEWLRAMADKL